MHVSRVRRETGRREYTDSGSGKTILSDKYNHPLFGVCLFLHFWEYSCLSLVHTEAQTEMSPHSAGAAKSDRDTGDELGRGASERQKQTSASAPGRERALRGAGRAQDSEAGPGRPAREEGESDAPHHRWFRAGLDFLP